MNIHILHKIIILFKSLFFKLFYLLTHNLMENIYQLKSFYQFYYYNQ